MYHRVAAPRFDPFALAVPPAWFQEHLEILQSRSRLVTLDEILRADAADPEVLASVTFDDGYVDNLAVASPILREAGIPATFFVCTGSLGDARGFWWDRLASAVAATSAPSAALEGMEGIRLEGDLESPDGRTRAILAMAAQLRPLRPDARDRSVEELEARLPPRDSEPREPCPVVDEAGLRDLASQPQTQLGAHTHRHPMLSRLTADEQLAEITRSADVIEQITGTRPRFVAYPYGGEQDYDRNSCLAAEQAGMSAAFVNHASTFDSVRARYRVPRYYVPPLQPDDFRTWLDAIQAA